MIEILDKLQFVGMIFAALLGVAFGSFLNVFLVRFPDGESMVRPRSHCRTCNHTLSWWENLPVLSWIFLKGRCRSCKSGISARYPIVELAVGGLWTGCWVKFCTPVFSSAAGEINSPRLVALCLFEFVCSALLCWLLVALTALDAEYFWLPDVLTLPGIGLGLLYILLRECIRDDAILPANLIHALWTGRHQADGDVGSMAGNDRCPGEFCDCHVYRVGRSACLVDCARNSPRIRRMGGSAVAAWNFPVRGCTL
jgi:hypothetical protein